MSRIAGYVRAWTPRSRGERTLTRSHLLWVVPAALLFFVPSIASLRMKSATFDEPVYVVAGLSYLTLHDYTMKDDAPPLVAYLAGLAPLAHSMRIPGDTLPFTESLYNEYGFAHDLLYRSGYDADRVLFWARLLILVPFGTLLLVTVSLWATQAFGRHAGVFALFLMALSPNLIAHGRLVTADFPVTAAMLFASYLLWRFTERGTWASGLAAGFGLGLALVIKFTALVLVPCFVVVLGLYAASKPRAQRLSLAAVGAAVFLPALLTVVFIYGWPPGVAHYVSGGRSLYRNILPDAAWGFLFGTYRDERIPYYYPAVIAVKASLPLLLTGIAGLALTWRYRTELLGELCLLLPAAALMSAAVFDAHGSGLRRVLPILPVLAIVGSRWLTAVEFKSSKRKLAVAGALLAYLAVSSLSVWPHYIPYYNEIARLFGSELTLLDDSDVDWGQDLKALPRALERNGIGHVYLWYFGSADPDYYSVPYTTMQPHQISEPVPGVYAISLQHMIAMRNTILERGFDFPWMFRQEPFDRAGTSILLFRVD